MFSRNPAVLGSPRVPTDSQAAHFEPVGAGLGEGGMGHQTARISC